MRDRIDTDNILHALDRAYLLLSNKNLPGESQQSWLKALRPYGTDLVLDAIDAHINGDSGTDSKYAPKPKHIVDLINRARDRIRGFKKNEPEEKPCDPRVAKAWVICMRKFYGFELTPDNNPHIEMDFEQALVICNQEAKKFNRLGSIPKEYRLS